MSIPMLISSVKIIKRYNYIKKLKILREVIKVVTFCITIRTQVKYIHIIGFKYSLLLFKISIKTNSAKIQRKDCTSSLFKQYFSLIRYNTWRILKYLGFVCGVLWVGIFKF